MVRHARCNATRIMPNRKRFRSAGTLEGVHGGRRVHNIDLEGPVPGGGQMMAERWADLQAAQWLARDPGISNVTYQTPRSDEGGRYVSGSFSQNGLTNDVRDGIYQINDGVSRDRLDQATARADSLYDDATQAHTQLLERQDPNDEGYGFYDAQNRALQEYAQLEPLRNEYNQGRYVTPGPNYDVPREQIGAETQPEFETQPTGGTQPTFDSPVVPAQEQAIESAPVEQSYEDPGYY